MSQEPHQREYYCRTEAWSEIPKMSRLKRSFTACTQTQTDSHVNECIQCYTVISKNLRELS